MKICFLAPADSAHTVKWCRYFVSRGYEVHVISFTDGQIPDVQVHRIDCGASAGGSDLQKLRYLTAFRQVKRIVRAIAPDMIHVHYATSYGAVAALAGLKNYVLSVWGSDIFQFPRRSPLHRWLLRYSLSRPARLFSTSYAMAKEGAKYTNKPFSVTPFGVDTELFTPEKRTRSDENFRIGTVKGLAPAYGIDTLLRAAARVRELRPDIPLQVRIAGKGPAEAEYKALSRELGLEKTVSWLGFIPQEQAAREWADLDLALILSNSESFGVSAVEAQSSGCPVVISRIPGLMEATEPGASSIAVEAGDWQGAARAVIDLYDSPERRQAMGLAGRALVQKKFRLDSCFSYAEKLLLTCIQ